MRMSRSRPSTIAVAVERLLRGRASPVIAGQVFAWVAAEEAAAGADRRIHASPRSSWTEAVDQDS
jgi:hypothetical protein